MSTASQRTAIQRINCPGCGAVMNPHAEKLVAPRTASEAASADWAMPGTVVEIHQCPSCGRVESRSSADAHSR